MCVKEKLFKNFNIHSIFNVISFVNYVYNSHGDRESLQLWNVECIK